MNACANCRCVHADDYTGKCVDCGAEMGRQGGGNSQSNLGFSFARQVQQGTQESAQESRMRRGDYSGIKIQPGLLDVARSFVTVDEELLAKLEAKANAA